MCRSLAVNEIVTIEALALDELSSLEFLYVFGFLQGYRIVIGVQRFGGQSDLDGRDRCLRDVGDAEDPVR